MKTFIGSAVIASALVSWQPHAHATAMVVIDVEAQPLTRAACDKAGLAWDDNGNVCDWKSTEWITQSSPSAASQRATKQGTHVNGHRKTKYTHRPRLKTQVVGRRPFPLFQLFAN
jgi:hypothetical protein